MSEALRTTQVTARRYLAGAVDTTIRKRLFFKMLDSKGRIILNLSGSDTTWLYEVREATIQPFGDGGILNFAPTDRFRQLTIDTRGYKATDVLTEKQSLMNKGPLAIQEYYKIIGPRLVRDMMNAFSAEFWIDGNVAGNENRLQGILSFMGDDGATNATDKVARPSDSYGGKSTAPAVHGGSWSSTLAVPPNHVLATDWPFPRGPVSYDCLSPKLVNTTSTSWGTDSTAWQDNCERVLRHLKNWCTLTGGEEGVPDVHFMGSDYFIEFQNHFEAERRILNPHPKGTMLGFPDTLNFEGTMIYFDFDTPNSNVFSINFDHVDLFSLDSVLFRSRGPDWDNRTAEYLFSVGYFGNLRWDPKFHGRAKAYA